MGDARGHWDGDTLVVETTNLREARPIADASANLKIIERFTPVDADTLSWEVRFEDPATWTTPWAFRNAAQAQRGKRAVRVRVPRRQPRIAEYLERRARGRA